MEIQEKSFDTGILTLNYAEGLATGSALVLLHGGNARWQFFWEILPNLGEKWHLYVPDLRGQGKSGRVPGRYRLQDYTGDTISFLRNCVREPAHLFGVSLGGIVALMVAAQAPDLVLSVVVGDAPLTGKTWLAALGRTRDKLASWRELAGGRISIPEIMERLKDAPVEVPYQATPIPMREAFGEDSPHYPWLADNLYQTDPDFFAALLDDAETTAEGYEMETLFPAIERPVLLLQADPESGGALTDVEVARGLQLLAQSSHVRLEGISHMLFNEPHGKGPVLRAVSEFLISVEPKK
ncbi:MAG TPA: alpha/beta hydrolase [Candidatus Binatia bacterium]|nr:alpha/beta hydrolase [Candidatus Binatia bacterium]